MTEDKKTTKPEDKDLSDKDLSKEELEDAQGAGNWTLEGKKAPNRSNIKRVGSEETKRSPNTTNP